jgi:hypothetical protein
MGAVHDIIRFKRQMSIFSTEPGASVYRALETNAGKKREFFSSDGKSNSWLAFFTEGIMHVK